MILALYLLLELASVRLFFSSCLPSLPPSVRPSFLRFFLSIFHSFFRLLCRRTLGRFITRQVFISFVAQGYISLGSATQRLQEKKWRAVDEHCASEGCSGMKALRSSESLLPTILVAVQVAFLYERCHFPTVDEQ